MDVALWKISGTLSCQAGGIRSKNYKIRCTRNPLPLEGISGEAHFEQVLQQAQESNSIVVIEWMAEWCRKCIYLKPQLEKLALEFQHRTRFCFVDVNTVPQSLVKRAGVTKMPTVQVWKNKKKTGEVIGGQKAALVVDEVRQMIQATHF